MAIKGQEIEDLTTDYLYDKKEENPAGAQGQTPSYDGWRSPRDFVE